MEIFDISPLINPDLAVFPGDVRFTRKIAKTYAKGDTYELSSMDATLHLGSHTDAPIHYHRAGRDISEQPLDIYMGPAQVLDFSRKLEIGLGDIKIKKVEAERVLLKTGTFDPYIWNDVFAFVHPDVVAYLAETGVRLIGIDTPSLDPSDSKTLDAHHAIYKRDLAILEGIVLDGVEEGLYELIALPLKIEGGDASPVRAVLRRQK